MDNGKNCANVVMLDTCRNNQISDKFGSGDLSFLNVQQLQRAVVLQA